ncbi:MerR family transcriptional regulator [Bacillus massiliigorillae]|uniref:MerR family transcriptional regulator n=1 Tax=Bacillus massiliigorillae TaxID=1243664 RepID=UPI0003A69B8F|nr:MerR family transcriptional regulator [Bacillus massiliigorillae]
MKQRFTIGEIAKLHNIPESTLRYYDQKGIFQPKTVDPQTQYRYYTIDQFSMLEIIKFLRHLDISLSEVKQYVEHRTPETALQLFEKQTELLLQKQREIEYMTSMMQKKIEIIKEGLQQDYSSVFYQKIKQRPIHFMPVESDLSDELFIMSLNELQTKMHVAAPASISQKIGTTISIKSILKGNYYDYNGLFISMEDMQTAVENYSYIREGYYACTYHKGSYNDTHLALKRLIKDIQKSGYEAIGDAIEIGLVDHSVIADETEFITEYQIPVKKIVK